MKHLAPEQEAEIAKQVRLGRLNKTPWKVLARIYRRSERQLRRYIAQQETPVTKEEKHVSD